MPPTYFPLRWESTGDQWWYASPIDYAAANGHYDLVRELLRIDGNHLFKLTSLRRIRRLEAVWDDEKQFDDVAKCRSQVAQKLLIECELSSNRGNKNSLIRAGYGGWLMYTAASAGDLVFVRQLLERNPLLAFGEGEYNVTDVLYAAARSKNCEVFRLLFDFAVSPPPRLVAGEGGILDEHVGEISSVYKWEMTNRAVHAAGRGGNIVILEEILADCSDVLAYRDAQGSTILHSASGRGQVEVIKYLTSCFDIINSTDHQGNTALHVAAYRGQLPAVEALVSASPALISMRNNAGETFLHKAVSGFQSPAFRRLDRQVDLLRQILSDKKFHVQEIVNVKNSTDGRTALHIATVGNIHIDLVQLLMTAPSINVNSCDVNGMTPLDYLKQSPNSATSKVLIRKLISAGGIFGCQGYNSRKAIASHLKMQGVIGTSPGTSFRISDTQIFLHTEIENNASSEATTDQGSAGIMSSSSFSSSSSDRMPRGSTATRKRLSSMNYGLRRVLQWRRLKDKKAKPLDEGSVNGSDEIPAPLRQRYFRPSTLLNNKRNLSVRSYQSSPNAKKRFASGLMHGVMQSMPRVRVSGRSRSSSFSMLSSISSPRSIDNYKQKGICVEKDIVGGPSCSSQQLRDDESANLGRRASVSKKLRGRYLCFGEPSLNDKTAVKGLVSMD